MLVLMPSGKTSWQCLTSFTALPQIAGSDTAGRLKPSDDISVAMDGLYNCTARHSPPMQLAGDTEATTTALEARIVARILAICSPRRSAARASLLMQVWLKCRSCTWDDNQSVKIG